MPLLTCPLDNKPCFRALGKGREALDEKPSNLVELVLPQHLLLLVAKHWDISGYYTGKALTQTGTAV